MVHSWKVIWQLGLIQKNLDAEFKAIPFSNSSSLDQQIVGFGQPAP